MNKLNITIETKEQRDEAIKQLQEMTFKKELPKSWEKLERVSGYWISERGDLVEGESCDVELYNSNIFATEKQAKSALAKAQLSQLMKVYNDGWVADWSDTSQSKYIIYRNEIELKVCTNTYSYRFLSFKDKQTRDLFLKNFKPLIRTYFELD